MGSQGVDAGSEWWRSAVIYEIYPRSFQDSDGDGVGDLAGVISRLGYLEWLGVDAIWLAPIYPSPLADFGYDISDYTSIAAEIGTDDQFDELVEDAHGRGIRLLLDLVVSHTSIEHRWFREHPDYYVWSDDGPANNWVASFGGPAWSKDEESGRWYLHSFFPQQPDLNWRNPAVREQIGEVVKYWLSRGVDGFRVDAADRLMKDRRLRDDPVGGPPFPLPIPAEAHGLQLVHSRNDPEIAIALDALRDAAGRAPLFGEVYLPGSELAPYVEAFDAVFSFDLLHAVWDAEELAGVLERLGHSRGIAWVVSNHDFSRASTRWGTRTVAAAAMLLLTLPGSAFIYQGEEIGMCDGPQASPPLDRWGRDSFRNPMRWEPGPKGAFTTGEPWLPMADPAGPDVETQQRRPDSLLNLYRRLIEARRRLDGPVKGIRADRGGLTYMRGDRHRVWLNTGGESLAVEIEDGWEVEIDTGGSAADSPARGDLELEPGHGLLLAARREL
jgi:alpha-glucosidase